MAIVLETYRSIKNFPNIEPFVFINIPIQIGIGKITTKAKQKFKPYIPDWFTKLEQKLLYPETIGGEVLELHKKSIDELWEQKATTRDSVYWSRNMDGDRYLFKNIDEDGDEDIESCGHFVERAGVHERNITIFKIRCKFLREYKTGRGNYENLGNYYYKSDEARRQFLEEVEQKGLVRKDEKYENGHSKHEDKLDLLFVGENTVGRNPATGEDVDNSYSFRDLNKCQNEKLEDEL